MFSPPGEASALPAEIFCGPTYCSSVGGYLGALGMDWLWGHCQPPCRFPEYGWIRYVVCARPFCRDLPQQFSRTQRGRTYFRETCPRAPKLAAVVGEVREVEYIIV